MRHLRGMYSQGLRLVATRHRLTHGAGHTLGTLGHHPNSHLHEEVDWSEMKLEASALW